MKSPFPRAGKGSRKLSIRILILFSFALSLFLSACGGVRSPAAPQAEGQMGQGWFHLPGYDEPSFLTYEIKDGYAIWQGDIILGEVTADNTIDTQGVARAGFNFRWPNRVVPFVINASFNATTEGYINDAIAHWEANTGINFVPRTTQADFIEFVEVTGTCSSFVGRIGGKQVINLDEDAPGNDNFCSTGAIIHEIGHAVGLYHEHTRTDRNSFVTINTGNIESGKGHNFDIPGDAFNLNSYDFRSIMHYGCFDFGITVDGVVQQTIVPINPPAGVSCTATGMNQIGQRIGLSSGDISAVNLIYTPSASLAWTQNSPSILDTSESNDQFGKVLATGDFNGDGRKDLAIGVPDESVGTLGGAGVVHVFYGSATGVFNTATDQLWHQNSSNVEGVAEAGDHFGAALAVGDFNNDGFDDLAIGVPDEDGTSGQIDSGAVNVLYGTASGLSAANDQIWSQDSSNIEGVAENNDRFGAALAAGDFNGDGFADLAIGVPNEDIENSSFVPTDFDAGAVNIIRGSVNRLTSTSDQIWTQDSTGIIDETEGGDQFGFALTAGDFNGDGRDDLAIGIPFEDIGTGTSAVTDAGAVAVLYGSTSGLSSTDQLWHQNSSGIADSNESGDNFGRALTAGDFNGDGRDDLVIGAPSEDVGTIINAGLVNVIYGSSGGLSATNNQSWTQNSSGIAGASESGDSFGSSLATGDLNNDGRDDLAIGVPFEDVGLTVDAGAVNIIFGSTNRLTSTGNRIIDQNTLGLNNASPETVAELGDRFGEALAVGDFDGNNRADLAIGVPGEALGFTLSSAGMINIINTF